MSNLCAQGLTCAVVSLTVALPTAAHAWQNILKDPGFEKYHFDSNVGYYVPDGDADWTEFGFGRASVRFDANGVFTPPAEMTAERPLGFSPGAMGFEGTGATQNTGELIFEQKVIDAVLPSNATYEAWVWLGGAGNDDTTGFDVKDEWGGWEVKFYNNTNTASWLDNNAIETHSAFFDYYGAPNGWVRVSGYGKVPPGTAGIRMRIFASTWYLPAGPSQQNTKVAVDNAHFAIIGTSNLLVNGNFEADINVADLVGWTRPAECRVAVPSECPSFVKDEQIILDFNDVYGDPFTSGSFRPYTGGTRAYGYGTFIYGAWIDDAFTFSQVVPYSAPEGTPLTFMFYWVQDAAESTKRAQMREHGGQVGAVLQYLDDSLNEISSDEVLANWPAGSNPLNTSQYDHNGGKAYNPRFSVVPPAGTAHVRVNVNVMTHLLFDPSLSHVQYVVDDFWLGYAEPVIEITNVTVQSVTRNSALISWHTNLSASSQVDYGVTTAYGQTETDAAQVTLHQVALTNLSPGVEYFFKVSSGNVSYPPAVDAEDVSFVTVSVGDFDLDGDIDQSDYGKFQSCYSGTSIPAAEGCEVADLDVDEDVDFNDFGIFQGCMSGANIPFDPACAG